MPYPAAVLAVAAVILAGTGAGVLAARRRADATAIADRMLWVSLWAILPVVTFFNFARFEPSAEVGAGLVFAYLGLAVALAVAWLLARGPLRLEGHTRGAFMCAAFHANTGFLGLPFTAALLGRDALPEAITYDQLVSTPWLLVVAFSIGAAHTERDGESRLRAFLTRNPALLAMVAGLLAPDSLAPTRGGGRRERARCRDGAARLLRARGVRDGRHGRQRRVPAGVDRGPSWRPCW